MLVSKIVRGMLGLSVSFLLSQAAEAQVVTFTNSATAFASPTESLAARSVTLGGTSITNYKAKRVQGTSCAGVTFSGVTSKRISAAFSFTPFENSSTIVCAIGRDSSRRWQVTPTASPVVVHRTAQPQPQPVCSNASSSFQNTPLSVSGNLITVEFDAKPTGAAIDGVMMISAQPLSGYTAPLRFRYATTGQIQARNGDLGYQAVQNLTYAVNRSDRFKAVIDLTAQTYSLTVTPSGQSAVTIASNYPLSANAGALSSVANFGTNESTGVGFQVCDLRATGVTQTIQVPSAPSGMTATAGTISGQIQLRWTDNSSNEASFEIERTAADEPTVLFTASSNSTSFIDTVTESGTYSYKVRSKNSAGASAYSNTASISVIMSSGNPQPDVGWTDLRPSADSRVIYVSNSGSDSNNGLTATTPKTLAGGIAQMRSGYPDWLLLKKGETYPGQRWRVSGRSASERMVISSYGTGNRPILLSSGGENPAFQISGTINHLAVVDVEFRGVGAGNQTVYTLDLLGGGQNILFEGVEISGGGYANRVQGYNARFGNIAFRRSIIAGNNGGTHSQGLYIAETDGITLEENVIDNNGWTAEGAYWWAQGVYIHGSCSRIGVVVRHNIFSNNAHAGVQMRSGGEMYGNLGFNNAVHFQVGTTDPDDPDIANGPEVTGSIRYNVGIGGHDLVPSQGPRGFGFWIDHATALQFQDNILTKKGNSGAPLVASFGDSSSITVESMIVFDWSSDVSISGSSGINTSGIDLRFSETSSTTPSESGFADPSRDLAKYAASKGLAQTSEAFINAARANSKSNWNPAFTAKEAIRYIRAGFSKTVPW